MKTGTTLLTFWESNLSILIIFRTNPEQSGYPLIDKALWNIMGKVDSRRTHPWIMTISDYIWKIPEEQEETNSHWNKIYGNMEEDMDMRLMPIPRMMYCINKLLILSGQKRKSRPYIKHFMRRFWYLRIRKLERKVI